MLSLYNSLTRHKEPFRPLDPQHVRMYVCGPTVYDRIHVGNARPFVVFDVLFRLLRTLYPHVTYVRNITDVDDKILTRAHERGLSPSQLTQETTRMFFEDIHALNVLEPTHQPRATVFVPQMIHMIQALIESHHAYEAEGHVLFETRTDPLYGSLSQRDEADMLAGARVDIAPYKKNPSDFVLWKPSTPDQMGWDSPWGYGRPGWHIECSAMSADLLGPSFDIHGGGQDLQFPHHENEMAQSRCAHHGQMMAHTWLHNGLITMAGSKMSKSLGLFVTLHEALHQHAGEVIRYFFLNTHYRHMLDWSPPLLDAALSSVNRLYRALRPYTFFLSAQEESVLIQEDSPFLDALCDDLNTPYALHVLHQWASVLNRGEAEDPPNLAHQLWRCGRSIGLLASSVEDWFQHCDTDENEAHAIEQLIHQRNEARALKDFATADRIREQLKHQGILLEDTGSQTRWHRDPSWLPLQHS